MLFGSLVIAAAGWMLMVPLSDIVAGAPVMDIPQFLVAFTLVTIAFPFGRGGGWMGLMFALGSVARIVGPFWAVHGYEMGPPIESLAHGESAIIVPPISTAPAASRPTRVALSKRSSVEEMAKALEEEMALS
ncbi:hypothetical protein EMIHUDRAFT_217487 [Emiliania huxleyi CCMP1516]|uniref:Uncharacterized protein n=2 Tax=Emiliania huxleyi TaxID=2903 RepID=A0A0D3IAS2_EMIH1|nr:hypothetical protein EMIHUDRAFT_217487 [Emiliania huxleyi CCMP1516]EOD08357.1 hypothetical protein EMIHUDRAFT_217487 [Emiliania huxleyi CCMP1516]|eukprot:XP_005760786.1 hypothetical protein EMIHUDRAFT_217487 [Emiliania huxleyi CCMP1516]